MTDRRIWTRPTQVRNKNKFAELIFENFLRVDTCQFESILPTNADIITQLNPYKKGQQHWPVSRSPSLQRAPYYQNLTYLKAILKVWNGRKSLNGSTLTAVAASSFPSFGSQIISFSFFHRRRPWWWFVVMVVGQPGRVQHIRRRIYSMSVMAFSPQRAALKSIL